MSIASARIDVQIIDICAMYRDASRNVSLLECSVFFNVYRTLIAKFGELLTECGKEVAPRSLMFFVDGIDVFEDSRAARAMQWLPETVPQVSFSLLSSMFDRSHYVRFITSLSQIITKLGALG
jgi:hypothetical protein